MSASDDRYQLILDTLEGFRRDLQSIRLAQGASAARGDRLEADIAALRKVIAPKYEAVPAEMQFGVPLESYEVVPGSNINFENVTTYTAKPNPALAALAKNPLLSGKR